MGDNDYDPMDPLKQERAVEKPTRKPLFSVDVLKIKRKKKPRKEVTEFMQQQKDGLAKGKITKLP